ncbi:MAG: hypothetical protein H8D46_00690, partial [FCB group bacterium]|nr:hypothetical protein [FCB group bacterium]
MNRYFKIMIVAALAMFTGLIAQTVTVSISDAGDNYLELYMINTEAVGGFQFTLGDDPEAFSLTGAAGGSAAAAGFLMSTSPEGLVLGFSLTGSTIPAGEGVLCTVAFNPSGDYTHITIDSAIISDPFGGSYETLIDQPGGFWEWGEPTVEPQAVTINAPMEGETVYGMDIDVSVSAMHLIEGDHFHAYLDGSLEGMYYTDSFTLMGVAYGPHTLTVTVADMNHVDYENPEATDTVNFENAEQTLEGYTLYLGDVEVLAGETVDVPLSLDNEDIVGGFQLQIMDFPDYADVVAVSTTDRTAGFSTSFNEQIDGSVLIVGFDLTLTGVTPGTGPILNIAYLSTGIYDSEINLSMITGASIISDLIGNPLPFDSENGSITVDGLDAPDVFAPENLNAVGGFSMINLLWTHPEPWDVVEYYIYRDGDIVGTATATNYTDTGLITEQTYCYTVVAVSEFNTSEHSNEACATTLAQFFEPPENLTAEENGLEVNLTWYPPASVNVCGDEVVGALPFSTVGSNSGHSDDWAVQGSNGADVAYLFNVSQPITIDVTLCTPDTDYDTKLEIFTADADCNETTTGYYDDDATCQYSVLYSSLFGVSLQPGSYYIVVDGYGGQEGNYGLEISESGALASLPPSIEESMSVESAKSGIEYTLETWDIADNETPTREFVGYEVYRDNQLLEFTTNNFYTDTDGLWYLQTYCYNVTAVYDDPGTSGFSNTACATPQLGEPSNLSAHGEGDFVRLNWLPHPDNAQTSFYVYRDGEFLAESTDPTYDDSDTVHDTEYCYTVTAYYDGTGESPATNEACSMWSLCPPAHRAAEAGDGDVDLTWDETSCGEEVFLQYSTNLRDNAFYFYDTYE